MPVRSIRHQQDPIPDPPEDLSAESKDLWTRLVPTAARSVQRRTLLAQGLRALDRADQARREVATQGLLVTTARSGVAHVNPLLKVESQARLEFLKVWRALNLTWSAQVDGRVD
jgi:phage terminase small subunit